MVCGIPVPTPALRPPSDGSLPWKQGQFILYEEIFPFFKKKNFIQKCPAFFSKACEMSWVTFRVNSLCVCVCLCSLQVAPSLARATSLLASLGFSPFVRDNPNNKRLLTQSEIRHFESVQREKVHPTPTPDTHTRHSHPTPTPDARPFSSHSRVAALTIFLFET